LIRRPFVFRFVLLYEDGDLPMIDSIDQSLD
jgi:hypothetical protein